MGNDFFFSLFNSYFGDQWVLTGSEAVKLYLEYINRPQLLLFSPNDRDILYLHHGYFYKPSLDKFQREQNTPQRSMTFKHPNGLSFDVTVDNGPIEYFLINGVRLLNPKRILKDYEDNERQNDVFKIEALNVIIESLNFSQLQSMSLQSANKRLREHTEYTNFKRSNLFEDEK
jgi:hypothetical protein